LIPDLAGFGDSNFHFNGDYRMAAQADHIAVWLQALGVDKVHLAGSSMGAAIAAQLAPRSSHPVDSLEILF
jgi:abhydrolase domain-containing protein 6